MTDLEAKAMALPYVTSISDCEKDVEVHDIVASRKGFFGKLRHFEGILDKKLGIEAQGPARMLPEERDPKYAKWSNQIIMAVLWASATMNLSCFTTGFLGWELGMSLSQTIGITILASIIGSATTGWCATMGPPTGLRQVSICRYSFGWYPSKVIAALNVVEQVGWSSVGSITAGLALNAVSDGAISLIPGVIIITSIGMIFSIIGLRAVLFYEKFAWLLFFIIFMIMYGELAGAADVSSPPKVEGITLVGSGLTLFAVVYGSSASWCSIVSDYYVQYPVDTSSTKVFFLTTFGIAIPTCIGMVLGCCVSSSLNSSTDLANVWYDDGVGYLLQTLLFPLGFAKFLLVILVLSGIGMNCIAMYSGALSIQQFARPLSIFPRFIWTLLLFAAIIVISIAGRDQILTVLQNFLSLLGYWNTTFFVIVFCEHYFFRSGWSGYGKYALEKWNEPSGVPLGIAGALSFAMGIVGAVIGMSETWYIGPIASLIGDGDLGNQLAFVFCLGTYIPARYVEKRWIGR